jgi:hypothetical protein
MKKILTMSVFAFLIIMQFSAQAATYYVTPSGDEEASGAFGDETTIENAVNNLTLSRGDTIVLDSSSGDYVLDEGLAITSGITIEGNGAVLDCVYLMENCITIDNGIGIVELNDFTVANSHSYAATTIEAGLSYMRNITFYSSDIGIQITNSRANLFVIHSSFESQHDYAIYQTAGNLNVKDSSFVRNDYGASLEGGNSYFMNNRFHSQLQNDININSSGEIIFTGNEFHETLQITFFIEGGSDIQILRNLFTDTYETIEVTNEASPYIEANKFFDSHKTLITTDSSVIFSNNEVDDCSNNCLEITGGASQIHYNTIVNATGDCIYLTDGTSNNGSEVHNNILYDSLQRAINASSASSVSYGGNNEYDTTGFTGSGDTGSNTHYYPQFINLAGKDYTLNSSSSLIGIADTSLATVERDIVGITRSSVTEPGAYSYAP